MGWTRIRFDVGEMEVGERGCRMWELGVWPVHGI